jgi:hypothetical protein
MLIDSGMSLSDYRLECETATARDYSMTIKESNTEDRGSKE